MSKIVGFVANSVDPDQMPENAASDLGLHGLRRPVRKFRVNTVYRFDLDILMSFFCYYDSNRVSNYQ